MKFVPRPNYVLIEQLPSETSKIRAQSLVELPPGFESPLDRSTHVVVELLRRHKEDTNISDLIAGQLIVVERAMIETIEVGDEKFDIIHTRHIVGEYFTG